MAAPSMYRGWIAFFTELVQPPNTVSGVRWVKGNMQPFKFETTIESKDTLPIELEQDGRSVFIKSNPFAESKFPDYNTYVIDPITGVTFKLDGGADWNTMSGRAPKHLHIRATREGYLEFPEQPTLTPTPSSVEEYEDEVVRLTILTNIFNKEV